MSFSYTKSKLLCKGQYSEVYLANSDDHGTVVLKQFIVSKIPSELMSMIQCEFELLNCSSSPYIIQMIALHRTPQFHTFILEYCDVGDLSNNIIFFRKHQMFFNENDIIKWSFDILNSLVYLHNSNIIHRTVEPENILLKTENNEIYAKLTGFSHHYRLPTHNSTINLYYGRPSYMAPEIYLRLPYSYQVDIWSLGCTMYELCYLKTPFKYDDVNEIKNHLLSEEELVISKQYSDDLSNIILMMLSKNPTLRSTAKILLSNRIFENCRTLPNRYTYPIVVDDTSNSSINQINNTLKFAIIDKQISNNMKKTKQSHLLKSKTKKSSSQNITIHNNTGHDYHSKAGVQKKEIVHLTKMSPMVARLTTKPSVSINSPNNKSTHITTKNNGIPRKYSRPPIANTKKSPIKNKKIGNCYLLNLDAIPTKQGNYSIKSNIRRSSGANINIIHSKRRNQNSLSTNSKRNSFDALNQKNNVSINNRRYISSNHNKLSSIPINHKLVHTINTDNNNKNYLGCSPGEPKKINIDKRSYSARENQLDSLTCKVRTYGGSSSANVSDFETYRSELNKRSKSSKKTL